MQRKRRKSTYPLFKVENTYVFLIHVLYVYSNRRGAMRGREEGGGGERGENPADGKKARNQR